MLADRTPTVGLSFGELLLAEGGCVIRWGNERPQPAAVRAALVILPALSVLPLRGYLPSPVCVRCETNCH